MSLGEDYKKDFKKINAFSFFQKAHTAHAGIEKKVKITCKRITER